MYTDPNLLTQIIFRQIIRIGKKFHNTAEDDFKTQTASNFYVITLNISNNYINNLKIYHALKQQKMWHLSLKM